MQEIRAGVPHRVFGPGLRSDMFPDTLSEMERLGRPMVAHQSTAQCNCARRGKASSVGGVDSQYHGFVVVSLALERLGLTAGIAVLDLHLGRATQDVVRSSHRQPFFKLRYRV